MTRPTRVRAAVVGALGLAALTLPAAAAQASYVVDPTPPPGPDRLSVNDRADVNHSGTRVAWRMRVTCVKGDSYRVYGVIRQYDDPLPAAYAGWTSYGTEADGERTGRCTGRARTVTLRLVVKPTTVIPTPTAFDQPETVFVPLQRARVVGTSFAKLLTPTTTERLEPFYCGSVNVEECEDATQMGPYLRLV